MLPSYTGHYRRQAIKWWCV